ncbi:hypothetical protein [Romboutsia lituseburensis]|uniref:hypothetical protein n=1 Tax=Romboutsia lituseburensis TaxID=1537 RepID=UPI00215B4113|nr:hypothetical protein [Romboutsia lituseburensis]MCR8743993.1 hypothetical protein [Romboutsia lituseburensis]
MDNQILDINKDIKRCEDVLIENSYLEIVIALEELIDKYKDKINTISTENNKVWSYTKNDLIDLKENIIKYKEEVLENYNKEISINTFNDARDNIRNNSKILKEKKYELINIIDELEKINNKNIDDEDKWNELKKYLIYTTDEKSYVSKYIISLINFIL